MSPPIINENDKQNAVRVSISEAARLFGVHARTIRRAILRQELRYIVVRNRYKLSFASLIAWSQSHATVQKKRDRHGIGQWVDQWKIRATKFSPRPPSSENKTS